MQGGYMTKNQRVKVAQQIRSTHFTLGGGKPEYKTTSAISFKTKPESMSTADQDHIKNIRKSHFSLGSDKPNILSQSESMSKFKPHKVQGISLQAEVKSDLRRHHFTLGGQSPTYATTSSVAFIPNEVTENNSIKGGLDRDKYLRQHNFKFGDDPETKKSVFKSDFGPKPLQRASDTNLLHLKEDLRASHFQVGTAAVNYLSTTQREFGLKNGEKSELDAKLLKELRKEHFNLGSDKPNMTSTSHSNHNMKSEGRQDLNSEKLQDLRSSHFNLGNERANYTTNSFASFKSNTAGEKERPMHTSVTLRKSHFQLGNDQGQYSTSYNQTHSGKQLGGTSKARDHAADWSSHIQLGSDPVYPLSTSQASFRPNTQGASGSLDPRLAKELRGHHFHLGIDGGTYKTTSGDYGTGKGEKSKIDQDLLNDLRASHFKYGSDPPQFISSNMKEFKPANAELAKQDSVLKGNLRKHHFKMGDDANRWNTVQRASYGWIQPVPDTNFHYSIDQ